MAATSTTPAAGIEIGITTAIRNGIETETGTEITIATTTATTTAGNATPGINAFGTPARVNEQDENGRR